MPRKVGATSLGVEVARAKQRDPDSKEQFLRKSVSIYT